MAVTGETTGRQCWEVHKDVVTGIIEKHNKDPAMVKRLADARNRIAIQRRTIRAQRAL